MKFKLYLVIILAFAACKKSNLAYENDFEQSYKAWTNFKVSSGNNYRYTVTTASWTGTSTQTTITVQAGKPVRRSYVNTRMNGGTGQVTIFAEWEEDTSNLNSHEEGFEPRTLDAIYQQAKTEFLPKRKGATIYFEAKNNGMLSSCGYVEDGCADDCFRGISIMAIEKL